MKITIIVNFQFVETFVVSFRINVAAGILLTESACGLYKYLVDDNQGPRNGFHLGVARSKYRFWDNQFSKNFIE